MKKSIKFFLIFGIVFLLIGAGMSFAALGMGAEFLGFNDRYYRSISDGRGPTSSSSESKSYTPFKIADITELELDIGAGNVYYEVTDELTDEIQVSLIRGAKDFDYEAEDEKLNYKVEEGKLKIEYSKKLKGIWKGSYMADELLIRVPQGYQFSKVDLELKTGGVWFRNLNTKKLEAEINTGGVEVLEGTVGELDLEIRAGGIKYEGSVSGNVKAECKAGGIELILVGEKKDFDYKLECRAGFINIDGETVLTIGGNASQNNNASKKIDLECQTGGIEVTFK